MQIHLEQMMFGELSVTAQLTRNEMMFRGGGGGEFTIAVQNHLGRNAIQRELIVAVQTHLEQNGFREGNSPLLCKLTWNDMTFKERNNSSCANSPGTK